MDSQSSCSTITMTTSVPKVKVRGVCWTLFHYTDADLTAIQEYAKDECEYLVFGKEVCPTTGTPHLQGYLYWPNPRSYPNKKFRALLNLEKRGRDCIAKVILYKIGHIVSKKVTFGNMVIYLNKERGPTGPKLYKKLKTDEVVDVIESQPQLAPCIRALERFKCLTLKPCKKRCYSHCPYWSYWDG